jgi:hypothetical protein
MSEKKEKIIQATHKKTGKVVTLEPRQLAKQIIKHPEILPLYDYCLIDDPRKVFTFEAWIHPKSGGDDYSEIVEIIAKDEEGAKKFLEKTLKRRSAVTNDYKLLKTGGQ